MSKTCKFGVVTIVRVVTADAPALVLASDQEWAEEEPQAEQGRAQHAEAQPGHGLVVKQVEEVGDHQLA